jgi:DNA-binding beta-propeller fold protein YncE
MILCAVLAGACSDSSGPSASDIVVEPASVTLAQGDSVRLVPSVVDENGDLISGVSISFSSDNEAIVTVSSIGMVRALGAAGTTTIKVRGAGITKSVNANVTAVPGEVILTPALSAIPQLTTVQLTATLEDQAGHPIPGAPITFVSSDPLATVSASGLVTSVGPAGTVTITAISGALSKQATVVVTQVPNTLEVPAGTITMGSTSQTQIGARVLDKVGDQIVAAPIVYQSSNTGIITVNAQGIMTSVGPLGSLVIRMTSGTLEDSVAVNVVAVAHPQGNITATTTVGASPYGGAISSAGVVYVAALDGTLYRGSITNWTFTPVLSSLGVTAQVAFSPSGARAYVAGDANGLRIIDVASNTVIGTVGPINSTLFEIVVGPDGMVYVGADGQVFKINPTTESLLDSVSVGAVVHMAIHPTQSLLYAQSANEGKVYEINTTTLDTIRSFTPGGAAQGVAVSLDGQKLYVADEGSNDLKVVTLSNGTVTNIGIGCQGWSVMITPDGLQVYVGCYLNGVVKIVDLVTNTVVKTLPTGAPRHMGIGPNGLSVVIANENGVLNLIQ